MEVQKTEIPGVLLIEPNVHHDDRGAFFELFSREAFERRGLPTSFYQDNVSFSGHGVIRGLHAQTPGAQGKLVTVMEGAIYDVALDVRPGSPTYGRWVSAELSAARGNQLYIPPGLAHGFSVIGERAVVLYKCTAPYQPAAEWGVDPLDPDLAIPWPVERAVLSARDRRWPRLRDLDPKQIAATSPEQRA